MPCLNVRVKRLGVLHLGCALVCGVSYGEVKYLRVAPEEVQWIYPQVVDYDVESNTTWTVS